MRSGFKLKQQGRRFSLALNLLILPAWIAGCMMLIGVMSNQVALAQQTNPAPPVDRTLIYYADQNNSLAPFSFETGATPLGRDAVAKSNRVSYVELKGEHAATMIPNADPRFYLFVPDTPNVHPPFLVRLAVKRGVRRAVATTERGQRGYAIESAQIVKPLYRVFARENGMFFMEVRPRSSLAPGEYAFIGADLARIATFHVVDAASR